MAFQEKYYFTFKGLDDVDYRFELWENTGATLTATEIRASVNPFVVTYPEFNLFDPVRGSGCQINLLSEYDRQFIGLYTPDFMQYQIRFKKNGGICWFGYLDSELYSEPFDSIDNYPVSFTGTDGLALLERIYYLGNGGVEYTGVVSQWTVLSNILQKLECIWSAVFVKISTTTDEFTLGSDETIFHKTLIRNENWYNEDGEPETCRRVLEEILRPYGASLIITDNMLFITDINTLLSGSTIFQHFSSIDFTYINDQNIDMNIGDLSDIGFSSTNQNLKIVSAINKQVVSYSPYKLNEIINFEATKDFSDISSTTTTGQTNYQWTETIYNSAVTWEASGNGKFASYIGVDGEGEGEKDSYLKLTPYGYLPYLNESNLSYTLIKPLPIFLPSENYRLKIEMEIFPRFSNDLDPAETTQNVRFITIHTRLKIGDKKYNYISGKPMNYGDTSGWVYMDSTDLDCRLLFEDKSNSGVEITYSPLDEKWTSLKYNKTLTMGDGIEDDIIQKVDFSIPLSFPYINGGSLEFTIYNYNVFDMDLNELNSTIIDLRIKNIKLSIVSSKDEAVNSKNVEYIGRLNPQYKNEGSKITTYCGYNITNHPTELGGLFQFIDRVSLPDYYVSLSGWTRASVTDNIENLFLRSLVSNYENPFIELSCSINRIDKIVGYLTYNNYLSKNLMITSCTHNFAEATTEIITHEINVDNLSIVKNY